jgi:mRNA-degrading endonuclease YafQ of YafQ-DinJ toxin-antitoxin module
MKSSASIDLFSKRKLEESKKPNVLEQLQRWLGSIPFSPIQEVNQFKSIHCDEFQAYRITQSTQTEIRSTEICNIPFSAAIKVPSDPITEIDPWTLEFEKFSDYAEHKQSIDIDTSRKAAICPNCDGDCDVTCFYCKGHGDEKCLRCFGGGKIKRHDNQTKLDYFEPCLTCASSGRIRCNICKGNGRLRCDVCAGRGDVIQFIRCNREEKPVVKIFAKSSNEIPNLTEHSELIDQGEFDLSWSEESERPISTLQFADGPGKNIIEDSFNENLSKFDNKVIRQCVKIDIISIVRFSIEHVDGVFSVFLNPKTGVIVNLEGPLKRAALDVQGDIEKHLEADNYQRLLPAILKGMCLPHSKEFAEMQLPKVLKNIILISIFGTIVGWLFIFAFWVSQNQTNYRTVDNSKLLTEISIGFLIHLAAGSLCALAFGHRTTSRLELFFKSLFCANASAYLVVFCFLRAIASSSSSPLQYVEVAIVFVFAFSAISILRSQFSRLVSSRGSIFKQKTKAETEKFVKYFDDGSKGVYKLNSFVFGIPVVCVWFVYYDIYTEKLAKTLLRYEIKQDGQTLGIDELKDSLKVNGKFVGSEWGVKPGPIKVVLDLANGAHKEIDSEVTLGETKDLGTIYTYRTSVGFDNVAKDEILEVEINGKTFNPTNIVALGDVEFVVKSKFFKDYHAKLQLKRGNANYLDLKDVERHESDLNLESNLPNVTYTYHRNGEPAIEIKPEQSVKVASGIAKIYSRLNSKQSEVFTNDIVLFPGVNKIKINWVKFSEIGVKIKSNNGFTLTGNSIKTALRSVGSDSQVEPKVGSRIWGVSSFFVPEGGKVHVEYERPQNKGKIDKVIDTVLTKNDGKSELLSHGLTFVYNGVLSSDEEYDVYLVYKIDALEYKELNIDKNEAMEVSDLNNQGLVLTAIQPLNLSISFSAVAGTSEPYRYQFSITRDYERKAEKRRPTVASLTEGTKNELFILREVHGPKDNPTEVVIELIDGGDRATLIKGKVFTKGMAFGADLTYPVENRNWTGKRVDETFVVSGFNYKIVSMEKDEIVVTGPNRMRTTIRLATVPNSLPVNQETKDIEIHSSEKNARDALKRRYGIK